MTRRNLLIASFGALFLEMLLVRWLPTTIYYLGYYKNCILFATFLGFGCGCATQRRVDRALHYFWLFIAAGVFAAYVVESRTKIVPLAGQEFLWPQAKTAAVAVPLLLILVIVFVASALLMVPLGRLVGRHLQELPPIQGYSINVGASLLGVASFLFLSYMNSSPVVWFTIAALPILYFVRASRRGLLCNLLGIALVIGMSLFFRSPREYWSPYSKISVEESMPSINALMLNTNNNGHQVLYDLSSERLRDRRNPADPFWGPADSHVFLYESAYSVFQPKSVLIVGGGTGNEAAAAVRHRVDRIDVVEIDPVIINIGRQLHPEHPYQNAHVTIINDDARHYMATTHERYDLVIFGFLDSTSHLSSMSNIRLDNYVYTLESFSQARSLLTPGGLLQVTYYAVADFVKLRIFLMIEEAFGEPPRMMRLKDYPSADIVFFVGPAIAEAPSLSLPGLVQDFYPQEFPQSVRLNMAATDDWPYLNVRTRSIGRDYMLALAAMILISFVFVRTLVWSGPFKPHQGWETWSFFLQGAGFMLLETNTITRMALILGSTWVVTSLAVMLVLLAALVANLIIQRFEFPSVTVIAGLLSAAILLNYFVDIQFYLNLSGIVRTLLASLQLYLPMLASSLLFGRLFQKSERTSFDFGMNILGALFGGMLEYSSVIVGIRTIYPLALALFLGVMLCHRRAATSSLL